MGTNPAKTKRGHAAHFLAYKLGASEPEAIGDPTRCISEQIADLIAEISSATRPVILAADLSEAEARRRSFELFATDLFALPYGTTKNMIRWSRSSEVVRVAGDIEPEPQSELARATADHLFWCLWFRTLHELRDQYFRHENRDELLKLNGPQRRKLMDAALQKVRSLGVLSLGPEGSERDAVRFRRAIHLDSQAYRLAPLNLVKEPSGAFRQVLIVEDNDAARKALQSDLRSIAAARRWGGVELYSLDVPQSEEKGVLVGQRFDGSEPSGELIELPIVAALTGARSPERVECLDHETLVCADLRLDGGAAVPGGLLLLYRLALNHPEVARVAVTGYRSHELAALQTGAASVVLKPYEEKELAAGIDFSRNRALVRWVRSKAVRKQWAASVDQVAVGPEPRGFKWVRKRLEWDLSRSGVRVIGAKTAGSAYDLIRTDVVILDLFPEGSQPGKHLKEFATTVATIRKLSLDISIIVLVPLEDPYVMPGEFQNLLRRCIRDGQDRILHKPLWVHEVGHGSLAETIRDVVLRGPKYDIKYVVFVPVYGLLWDGAVRVLETWKHEGVLTPNSICGSPPQRIVAWAPFALLTAELMGFHASRKQLRKKEIELVAGLQERVDADRRDSPPRWERLKGVATRTLVVAFVRAALADDGPLSDFLDLEAWINAAISPSREVAAATGSPGVTQELSRLFGGETRSRLGDRGVWFDESGVECSDTPMLIEFSARRGLVARTAIRDVLVEHLLRRGGEKVVLVQEIPMKGSMEKLAQRPAPGRAGSSGRTQQPSRGSRSVTIRTTPDRRVWVLDDSEELRAMLAAEAEKLDTSAGDVPQAEEWWVEVIDLRALEDLDWARDQMKEGDYVIVDNNLPEKRTDPQWEAKPSWALVSTRLEGKNVWLIARSGGGDRPPAAYRAGFLPEDRDANVWTPIRGEAGNRSVAVTRKLER